MTGKSITLPGIIMVILALVAVLILRKSRESAKYLNGSAMGTQWIVEWRGNAPERSQIKKEISLTLEEWEQVLSQWRQDSDLSRHNRGEPVTEELARVLILADGIKERSGGAFNHHLLKEVHAAGFGPDGVGIDLSSIGKGFAVDRVCERLQELGMRDFVFALAGEVRAVGGPWPVEIEKPLMAETVLDHVVMLKNDAIATSGNYRQFRQTEEGLLTHIIDPETRRPVIRPPSSVTVIAADCATASAWATALFVRGPKYKGDHPELRVSWQHP
jgi:thiamine biosynthesis lipoprotein